MDKLLKKRRSTSAFLTLLALICTLCNPASIAAQAPCGDLTLDDCATVVVPLDYQLIFNGCEGGVEDGANLGTGFTMVQPHSENRLPEDEFGSSAPFQSFPAVPGYEPSRLAVNGGVLTITASRGIAYLDPPASSFNNNQINTLGVGLQNPGQSFVIRTQINALSTGGSSAQAGLWYGLDEDNFVKLVAANDNQIEIRVEESGLSTQTNADRLQISENTAGQDILFELEVDVVNNTVEGFYTIGNGNRSSTGSLNIPASFVSGITLADGTTSGVSFAGIFATYRNGSVYDADFESFSVSPIGDELSVSATPVTGSVAENSTGTVSLDVSASNGAPTVSFTAEDCAGNVPTWLSLSGTPLDGTATHNTSVSDVTFDVDATGLTAGTYTAKVTTSASGYASAVFEVELTVTAPVSLFTANINFQDDVASTTPPAGYEADFGEAYGSRGNGLTYGWIDVNTGAPVSLVGQGRNRGISGLTLLQNTVIHMEHPNTPPTGFWEIQVPNGTYQVTVTVGDGNGGSDPEVHRINAEGTNIINDFTPTGTGSSRFQTGTGTCTVNDGKLTLDYLGGAGINTKLAHVEIVQTSSTGGGGGQLSIVSVIPAPGAINVDCFTTSVSVNGFNFIPGAGSLNNNTLIAGAPGTPGTVNLRDDNGVLIAGSVNGTAGGDNINFSPNNDLAPNTTYTFEVTSGVQDLSGNSMQPWTSSFTTGSCTGGPDPTLADFSVSKTVGSSGGYTTLTIGPDGKLYGLTDRGLIKRWDILRTGDPTVAGSTYGTLINEEVINTLQVGEGGDRLAIGMDFDPSSTSNNLILWVTHSSFGFSGMPDWDGKISRLDGPDLENYQLYVTNLPRSVRDHLTNSIDFGPDGAMYVMQGSNSAMGAPDGSWGNRPERLLTAACLRIDPSLITNPPLDVQTEAGGNYNPYAANAPVKIFATGTRNPYDLVWHSNGNLYIPTNGSASGGNSPASVSGTPRPDGTTYSGQIVPAVTGHPTQPDLLFRVPAPVNGSWPYLYFGHPNPTRGEYVLNGGNPTSGPDPLQVSGYPVGITPDANYAGIAFNFENSKSPNGVIEYQSNAFGGALQGALIVCRYSGGDDLYALVPGGNGDIVTDGTLGGSGAVSNPLDVIEDPQTGVLYVSEYGSNGSIRALIPDQPATGGTPQLVANPSNEIVQDQVVSAGPATVTITVSNPGSDILTLNTPTLGGTDAGEYSLDLSSFSTSVAAGSNTTFDLEFDPGSAGPKAATLTITGNAASGVTLDLKGLGKQGTGGSSEPSLQWIVDAYQLGIDVGDDDDATNILHSQSSQYTAPLLGPDEVAIQSFEKAGPGSVSLELLAVYGPTGTNPIVNVGYYLTGDANSTTQVLSVDNSPTSNGQSLQPPFSGSLTFDPGTDAFGFYSEWPFFGGRQLFSEDALNTFSGAIPHHVRVYPIPGETNAYLIATEEHVSGFDFQDVIFIARNVQPAMVTSNFAGEIRLENMFKIPGTQTGFPSDSFLVFSRINNVSYHQNRESQTLRIHNDDATEDLQVSALTLSNPAEWDFPNGEDQNLPLTIPAGGSVDIDIDFVKSSGGKGIYTRSLTIASSDSDEPSKVITLSGAYMQQPEGGSEITTQEVFNAFGFTTTMLSDGVLQPRPNSDFPDAAEIDDINAGLEGDWIFSTDGWFERADPSEPIVAFQLAAYHGPGGAPTSTAGGGSNISFNHDGDWHQSLLPKKSNNNDVAHDIENTSGQFRLQTAGYSTQGRNFNTTTPDLGYRVYKVRDVNGNIIPNTFLGVQDYVNNGCGAGSANCDWNDNVVYWVNIKPVANASLGDVQNLAATAGQPVSYDISQFADNGYAGNGLVYTAELVGGGAIPAWLTLDPQTGELSGTPPFNVTDPIDIEVTITDDNQNSYSDPFTMNVSGTTALVFDGNEVITDATACGNVDGSIQVGTTGAVGTVTYTLTPGGVSNTTGLFSGLTPGSYTIEAEDDNDPGVFISATFDVGPTGCGNCSPISPLACGLIEVDLTNCFELTWDAGEGGIASTGFTMVDAPSQTLATNPLPDDPAIPGLVSANINVTGGQLQITSSNGIQFESNSGSTENNSQQNALGVGFNASASTFTVTTTLVNPDLTDATSAGNNAQQAGIWFGLDEDNYVKLVVGKTGDDVGRIEMLRENTDPNDPALVVFDNEEIGNAVTNASTQTVELYLTLDPVAGTAAGSFSLDGGTTVVDLPNTLTVPANFFTGELLPDGVNGPMSFAGVFTTHRRAAQNDAITFNFEDFAIRPDGNNCQAPTNQAPVANNDSETTAAGVVALVNILTNDSDSDGTLDPATVDLDPNTPGTEEASLTIAGEGVYTYSVAAQQLTFTPEAGFAGTSTASYTVKDDLGEVSNVATVTITVTPVISCTVDAGPAQTLDCNNPSVFLSGNTSTGTYLWTTTDGNIVAGANTASPEVDAPGTYTLSVPGAGGITPFAQINFQDQASAAPAGYEADFGEAYGSKGSLTYGWVDPNNGFVGLDLSSIGGGNGRNRRDVAYSALSVAEQLEATMMHIQYNDVNNGNGTNGNPVEGAWEIQVPNGDYEVIVALGDYNPVGADPEDFYLNVEGVAAVTNFVPSGSAGAATNFTTATVTVTVTDGRLTLDAIGGTNTKITHVAISSVTSACAATDQVVVDEKSLLDAGLIVGTCNSNTAGDPSDDTFDFTLDPSGTSLTGTYTVSDANGVLGTGTYGTPETFTADADGVDLALTITDDASGCTLPVTVINPGPCAELCNPLSTLDCADLDVDVSNGFCLDFAGSGGGLSGTGFTMVVNPSAPLSPADDPTLPAGAPTNPSVDGYEPSLLNIAGGQLTIAATKGIMFSELGLSTETNSSVNHLGVAFDANLAQPYDIETEMVNLPTVGTDNSFHQGGLWFGLGEANYVKLVAIRDGNAGYRVQLAYEENDLSGNNNNLVEENSQVVLNTGDDVILRMTVDPTANTVAGFYSLDGGANFTQVGVGPITVGAALFQGITLPDASGPLSFAGVHASLRRGTTPLDFTFEGFCINEQPQAVLADVNGSVTLPASCTGRVVTVEMYDQGTSNLVQTGTASIDANGNFTMSGMPTGDYDLYVSSGGFLKNGETVTLVGGSNSVNFGVLLPGDVNGDNTCDGLDFSALSASYNATDGDSNYNPNADFNCDGFVDGLDFSSLSGNYNQSGDSP